jgi:hypothetical protein
MIEQNRGNKNKNTKIFYLELFDLMYRQMALQAAAVLERLGAVRTLEQVGGRVAKELGVDAGSRQIAGEVGVVADAAVVVAIVVDVVAEAGLDFVEDDVVAETGTDVMVFVIFLPKMRTTGMANSDCIINFFPLIEFSELLSHVS